MDTLVYANEKPEGEISLHNKVLTIKSNEPEKMDILIKRSLRKHV